MTDERAVATRPQPSSLMAAPVMPSGMAAVAMLTDDEFARNLQTLKVAQDRTRQIQQTLMTENRDYGVVPGTKKPTLLKPGAEILTLAYGFVARIETEFIPGDGKTEPALRYDATCTIHVGSWTGPIVAIGFGSCNSWETKYRYRTTSSGLICPECGKAGLIRTRERPAEGRKPARAAQYWHPPDARPDGGCNSNFPLDDDRISGQRASSERVENPDPYDVMNTILKISEKRAHVDAILRATGTSGLFTVEEEEGADKEKPDARSRREFSEWVAEAGLDPVEVQEVGKRIYPERDLRKLSVWERTAWRSILEREVVYATPEQRAARAPSSNGQPQAQQRPQPAQGAQQQAPDDDAPPPSSGGAPRNVTPLSQAQVDTEREAIRADVRAGRTADQIAEGIEARSRDREGPTTAGGAKLFTAEELADLG